MGLRINIDEKWKTDPRRTALAKRIGSRGADGMLVEITWLILAHRGLPIPLIEFRFVENYQDWIECGLAELSDDKKFVHVAGADRYAEFFEKQKKNGEKGGRPKITQTKPRKPKHKPENPSSSISSSSSSSSSGSSSPVSNSSNSTTKVSDFVAAYCERFKSRWNENPHITGKESGIAKRLAKSLSLDRFKTLLDAYFSMPDAWLVKQKHPLNLFESKLNEVVVFAGQGKFTTVREVRQADDMATTMQMLKDVREGKL